MLREVDSCNKEAAIILIFIFSDTSGTSAWESAAGRKEAGLGELFGTLSGPVCS